MVYSSRIKGFDKEIISQGFDAERAIISHSNGKIGMWDWDSDSAYRFLISNSIR